MLTFLIIGGAVASLGVGIYIGLGAPGWPTPPRPHDGSLKKRPINPIAWGGRSERERFSTGRGQRRRNRMR